MVEIKRPVKFAHDLARAFVLKADNDAVGMLEVADRRALPQELWIRYHRNIGVRARLTDNALGFVASPNWYGGLGDDHREPVHRARNLARRIENIREIGMTVAAPRRRADGD